MRLACVLAASLSGKKRAWHSRTSCCSFIVKFCTCTDASCVRPRRVLHAFQARLARVSDAFERYLKAELYCSKSPLERVRLPRCLQYSFKSLLSLFLSGHPDVQNSISFRQSLSLACDSTYNCRCFVLAGKLSVIDCTNCSVACVAYTP